MTYLISFLEGIVTFISPCLLPMLPVYLSYFAGGGERSLRRTLLGATGFVAGFTAVFVLMGMLAGTLGGFLARHQVAVNAVSGVIVILFGLSYLGLFRLPMFRGMNMSAAEGRMSFLRAMVLGMAFSVGWTPCVGAFLGSALLMASQQGSAVTGLIMLLAYSLGLGVPFLISAVLIDQLKTAFDFIKRHYRIITLISGIFLVVLGLLMATGLLGRLTAMMS